MSSFLLERAFQNMFLRKLQSVLREVFKKEKKFHTEIVHTLFLGEKRGVPLLFTIFGPNFMNFEDFSKYFFILGGKVKKKFFARGA